MERINWYYAVKWCNARSEMEGRPAVYTVNGLIYRSGQHDDVVQRSLAGYRLPTATEWEYAARGGLTSKRFPWGDTINHGFANYSANGSEYSYDTSPYRTDTPHPTYNDGDMPYTSPVGSFAPNGYGLYDMAGNVEEWCFDWSPSHVGSSRIFGGGDWRGRPHECLVDIGFSISPGNYSFDTGMRTVLSPADSR